MKIKKRKYVKFRHKLVYFLIRPFFRLYLKWKYNFTPIRYRPKVKGPHLILANHALNLDPFFLAGSFRTPIYYVASEVIFSIKFASKVIRFLVAPIPKSKSRSDLGTTKQILSIVKEGGWIGVYPEGNATTTGETIHMPKGISKLIKLLKIPVLFYRLKGGYLSNPRWGEGIRKGKTVGEVVRTWNPKEYKDLSEEEIFDVVSKELYVNAYNDQANDPVLFKSKEPAHYLERVLFVCPKCLAVDKLYSVKDHVLCKSCSLEVQLDNYGFFNDAVDGIKTVIDWDMWQKEKLPMLLKALPEEEPLFDSSIEHVREHINEATKKYRKDFGYAKFTMTKRGFTLDFKDQTWMFAIEDILEVAMQDKYQLILYTKDGRTLMLKSDRRRSAYKHLVAFQWLRARLKNESPEYLGL